MYGQIRQVSDTIEFHQEQGAPRRCTLGGTPTKGNAVIDEINRITSVRVRRDTSLIQINQRK